MKQTIYTTQQLMFPAGRRLGWLTTAALLFGLGLPASG
jgi:hypothetical protein